MSDEAKTSSQSDLKFAYEILRDLGESEHHFNEIQAKYRPLASTWLLAAFWGMGYLLSATLSIDMPTEVAVFVVGIAGSSRLLLLWIGE